MDLKCLPFNPQGTVAIGAVGAVAILPANRAQKPYPPGSVKVNGDAWPNGATYHGDVMLAWAHRNRTAQAGAVIVQQDAASVAAGPEGTYTVEVLVAGVVKQTAAGLTGTSYVYTWAQRQLDDANLAHTVQFRITPVNGTQSGHARTTDSFLMAA